MHSLPTIVVMNMTDEQREVYNLQESARIAARDAAKAEQAEQTRANWAFAGILIVVAVVVVVAFIV
jgi:hypothetical protein